MTDERINWRHGRLLPVLLLVVLLALCVNGVLLFRLLSAKEAQASFQQVRQSAYSGKKYQFIDPLLTCDSSDQKDSAEFQSLKAKVENVVSDKLATQDITTASVYVRWNGKWMGINTNEKYVPASLMKVPTMIAVLKAAQSDPALLFKLVTYAGDFDLNQGEYFKPSEVLEAGHSYTMEELVRRMVVDSDNNALLLLEKNMDPDELNEVYTDLGISIPTGQDASSADFMTVKNYANIFRILYNASYLNRDMSEKALDLLSEPDFPEGIQASLPAGIAYAQKFGERNFSDNPDDPTGKKELHDCGFVYPPQGPYLVCIMTRGTDFEKMAGTIRAISKEVFQFIDDASKKT